MSRNIETYAPKSFNGTIDELVQPTAGYGVEVLVAWRERVIGTWNFFEKGVITVGIDKNCDIQIPVLPNFHERLELIKIGASIEVQTPLFAKIHRTRVTNKVTMIEDLQPTPQCPQQLGQNEIIEMHFAHDLKILIRCSQKPQNPKLIPLLDITSNGFLSVALSVTLSLVTGVVVFLNPVKKMQLLKMIFSPVP